MRARRWVDRAIGLARAVPTLYVDTALALVFTVVGVVEPLTRRVDGFDDGPMWLTVAIGACMGVPLVLRRRAPAVCFLTLCAAIGLPGLFVPHGLFFWSQLLPFCLALYPAARLIDGPLGQWGWALGILAFETDSVHSELARQQGGPWLPLVLFGGVSIAARLSRRSAGEAAQLAQTLARLAEERSAREELAVQDERNRIAAEVHDVVAHAVSVMVLQVGAARMGLEGRRHPVPDQLRAAEVTGREALAELRVSIGALIDRPERGPLHPLPGLAEIDGLVDRVRGAGLDLSLERDVGELPTGLQLTVYRLLQESLTNVLKHAGPVPVAASVVRRLDDLVVEVSNPRTGQATGVPSGRHGLVGLRERVAMYGGELVAGAEGDRFVVRARIPVPALEPELAGVPA